MFGLLFSVTLSQRLVINTCFLAPDCPSVSSEMSGFVGTDTAGKCPEMSLKIFSGFTLTNVDMASQTAASRQPSRHNKCWQSTFLQTTDKLKLNVSLYCNFMFLKVKC